LLELFSMVAVVSRSSYGAIGTMKRRWKCFVL
jgi:hypothetical protein